MSQQRSTVLQEMKICRFCLSNDEASLSSIYDRHPSEAKSSTPLPLQIMACVAIEVFKNDGMPQLICNSCRKNTLQAYAFKSNCKRADDSLKLFLATGQMAKPYFAKIDQIKSKRPQLTVPNEQPKKQEQKRERQDHQSLAQSSKRVKMEDGTEIITLNLTSDQNSNDAIQSFTLDETSQNNEDDDMEFNDSIVSGEDNAYSSQEEGSSNKPEPKKVPTDCFSCQYCDRSFPLKQLLDLHVPTHKREREFECGTCMKKFFNKYDLSRHFMTHNSEKNHQCIVCSKSFSTDSLLKRHEKVHLDVPKFVCNRCNKQFLTKEYLQSHLEKHKRKKPFTCGVCGKSFVFKQGLERHESVHNENKPHKCNYCEASFNTAIKLARHITTHAGLRPYPCKICSRTFLLSHHLTRHMRSHYAIQNLSPEVVINRYKCDTCSMSFRRKDSLVNHSMIHSMVNLKCVICNTTFESAQLVKDHITTHLSGLPFPCEKCDYSFETSEQLEEHELKHAEMEYEEQIEKEVISEAIQKDNYDMIEDDEEVTEYTIPDFENPDVVPSQGQYQTEQELVGDTILIQSKGHEAGLVRGKKLQLTAHEQDAARLISFLKDEDEDNEENSEAAAAVKMTEPESAKNDIESIKPIVRQEGTKVYQRKTPIERKKPEPIAHAQNQNIRLSSLDSPTTKFQVPTPTTSDPKKFVNMKVGDQTLRVQKFIVTKDEMKAMAKQGILEIKNGQVMLKSAGNSILNATLKPLQKNELDSLLDKKQDKIQVKKYSQRRSTGSSTLSKSFASETSTDIDLDDTFTDLASTTLDQTLDQV